MRIIGVLVLVFGAALAAAAVFFMSDRFRQMNAAMMALQADQQNQGPVIEAVPTTPIVIASAQRGFGQQITAGDMQVVDFPTHLAPANGFATLEEIFPEGIEARLVLTPIEVNEPVLKGRITGFGDLGPISTRLRPGYRAYTLRIDDVAGVSGFVRPGDQVDVFWTRRVGGEMVTELMLQGVSIIGIDQKADTDTRVARVGRTATVEVTPLDAQKLALAQDVGRLTFNLRGVGEADVISEPTVIGIEDITSVVTEEVVQEEVAATPTVRVRRGIGAADEIVAPTE